MLSVKRLFTWAAIMNMYNEVVAFPFRLHSLKTDKLITGPHISIKKWFSFDINVAFQTWQKEQHNLKGSNKANLVLIHRNPFFFFFWWYSEDSACISPGLHYQAWLWCLLRRLHCDAWHYSNCNKAFLEFEFPPSVSIFIFCQYVSHFQASLCPLALSWAQVCLPSAAPGHF